MENIMPKSVSIDLLKEQFKNDPEMINILNDMKDQEDDFIPYNRMSDEDKKKYDELLQESIKESEEENEENFEIDPLTGTMVQSNNKYNDLLNISFEDLIDNKDDDVMNEDMIKDAIENSTGLDDVEKEDIKGIVDFMKTVDSTRPDKYHPLLPQKIKDIIDGIVNKEKLKRNGLKDLNLINKQIEQSKENFARYMYDSILNELRINKATISLDSIIKKELGDSKIMDLYLDDIIKRMETDLKEQALKLAETDIEKSKRMMQLSKSFTDSYHYTLQNKKIKNKGKSLNKELEKDIKNITKRCNDINNKYKDSRFTFPDIKLLLPCLQRHLPSNISNLDIMKFMLLTCKIFNKMDNENIFDHTYMYYTVRLIQYLDYVDKEKTKMYDIIINNIVSTIENINKLK